MTTQTIPIPVTRREAATYLRQLDEQTPQQQINLCYRDYIALRTARLRNRRTSQPGFIRPLSRQ